MLNLFNYLVSFKKYSDVDAFETVILFNNGMPIPSVVKSDIDDYFLYRIRHFIG